MDLLYLGLGFALGIVYAEMFLRRREMPFVWRCKYCAETRFSGSNKKFIDQMAADHMAHFHPEES